MLLSVLVPFLAPKWPVWAWLWVSLVGASLIWATSLLDGILALWTWILIIGMILIGKTVDFHKCMVGYTLGIGVNSVFCVLQFYGIDIVPKATGNAGLMVNPNFLAAASLLAIVWAVTFQRWWLALICLPALLLPMAKGPVLVGSVMLIVWLIRKSPPWGLAALAALAGCIFYYFQQYGLNDTSLARWHLWQNSVAMFQWHGHGVGSFWSAFPQYWNAIIETSSYGYGMLNHPKTAHNDFLTLAVELGVLGIITYSSFVALCFIRSDARYVLVAFLGVGLFSHPLFIPNTAAIAALACGDILRRWDIVRATNRLRRDTVRNSPKESGSVCFRALFEGGWSDAFAATFPRWRGVCVHDGEHGPTNGVLRDPERGRPSPAQS